MEFFPDLKKFLDLYCHIPYTSSKIINLFTYLLYFISNKFLYQYNVQKRFLLDGKINCKQFVVPMLRKSKTALITGITGQDGAYLAQFLLNKGYTVYGTYRRVSTPNFWRLNYLGIYKKIKLIPVNFLDQKSVSETILKSKPDEIYHLAAQSFVSVSFDQPVYTTNITGLAVTTLLEEIRKLNFKRKR